MHLSSSSRTGTPNWVAKKASITSPVATSPSRDFFLQGSLLHPFRLIKSNWWSTDSDITQILLIKDHQIKEVITTTQKRWSETSDVDELEHDHTMVPSSKSNQWRPSYWRPNLAAWSTATAYGGTSHWHVILLSLDERCNATIILHRVVHREILRATIVVPLKLMSHRSYLTILNEALTFYL